MTTTRTHERVSTGVLALAATAVAATCALDVAVAPSVEAGATTGIAGLVASLVRGAAIDAPDAWASAIRRVCYAILLGSAAFALPAVRDALRRFESRFVGEASAETVALLRVAVAGVLLVFSFVEDLPSVADLPLSTSRPKGIVRALDAWPLFHAAFRDPDVLTAWTWGTRALLLLALLGVRGRVTVPLAALASVVFGGVLRSYANFFHTGLLPVWMLCMLSFFPTTDAWSIDALGARPILEVASRRRVYGWARYATFAVLFLAYYAAGTSKIFNGGLLWWHPDNLRMILAVDALNPMELPFEVGLHVALGPDWVLALLGLSAIVVELAMVAALFSHRARVVLPAAMASMHVGIAILQNVLFADLIFLLVIFYVQRATDRGAASDSVYWGGPVRSTASAGAWARGGLVFASVATVFVVANAAGIEQYPITGMQMYSRRSHDGVAHYQRIVAIDDAGHEREARPDAWVWALRDSRYRFHVARCFREDDRRPCLELLDGLRSHLAVRDPHVVAVEAQAWEWALLESPDDPAHGSIRERVRVDESGHALVDSSLARASRPERREED